MKTLLAISSNTVWSDTGKDCRADIDMRRQVVAGWVQIMNKIGIWRWIHIRRKL
ncbi:MAG: hypothetical protein V4843_02030 [Pseudomonadota bacterium]|uniref:hypothetical protein n=1 Tax=Acidovorax sp. LjRoot38 TaxID=3342327 RepID=UPI0033645C34